jgi:lipoprotein NlpI
MIRSSRSVWTTLFTRGFPSGSRNLTHTEAGSAKYAYYNRGIDLDEVGDHDKAIADYTKAIELDPKYVYAYVNRGVAWSRKAKPTTD